MERVTLPDAAWRTKAGLAELCEVLGAGESLFAGIDLPKLGYECSEHVPSEKATHVVLTKRK